MSRFLSCLVGVGLALNVYSCDVEKIRVMYHRGAGDNEENVIVEKSVDDKVLPFTTEENRKSFEDIAENYVNLRDKVARELRGEGTGTPLLTPFTIMEISGCMEITLSRAKLIGSVLNEDDYNIIQDFCIANSYPPPL